MHTETENASERNIIKAFFDATHATHEALCDSFHTPLVMLTISELISTYNVGKSEISKRMTRNITQWVTNMVNIFGLGDAEMGWSGVAIPEIAKLYIYPLSALRDDLRVKARSGKLTNDDLQTEGEDGNEFAQVAASFKSDLRELNGSQNLSKEVLQLCDRLRDVDLWEKGIYLEDRDGQPALVRPVTRELLAARREREELKVKPKVVKEERGRLSHFNMFQTDEYSAWDSEGFPLKDKEGEEITKSKRKKLTKDWERQKKAHEIWLRSIRS